jgi:hypothetical protein
VLTFHDRLAGKASGVTMPAGGWLRPCVFESPREQLGAAGGARLSIQARPRLSDEDVVDVPAARSVEEWLAPRGWPPVVHHVAFCVVL